MLDPAITDFFSERKQSWLKKKLKTNMSDDEIRQIEIECESEFSPDNWLPNAAKRAKQMSISTHPCTFSHPSARKNKNGYVTSIIADKSRRADGYLRTGNVSANTDALGNAAALDVYKFLSIATSDNRTVLEHIQEETELAKALLNIRTERYDNLKDGFLAMASSDQTVITSSKIKQVYFPVENDYHQLSILTNSGIVFELRRRIDALRFSDAVKEGRDLRRNNKPSDSGYSEIFDITTIGYGGTKPQNISVLNNQYGGKAHLLLSIPPFLEKRDIKFPTQNFFKQSVRYYDCRDVFERLHRVLTIARDGSIPLEKIRRARDRCLSDILDVIMQKVIALRGVSEEQFFSANNQLEKYQQIWLCEQFKTARVSENDWLDKLSDQLASWIHETYTALIKQPVLLGQAERAYFKEFVNEHKEVLR